MEISDIIIKYFLKPLGKVFSPLVKANYINLRNSSRGLTGKELFYDFGIVLLSVSLLLILNVLAILIFIYLPQGKDALLVVIDDLSSIGNKGWIGGLISLIIGVSFWAIISEFASRYAIYVTDNSAKSITSERVEWRKAVQELISDVFLVLPFFTVFISLLINYIRIDKSNSQLKYAFYATIIVLYAAFYLLSYLYFSASKKGKTILPASLKLNLEEKTWASKLYGIYNNFIFSLFLEDDFSNVPNYAHNTKLNAASPPFARGFPQNSKEVVNLDTRVNKAFVLIDFSIGKDGRYKWTYFVPNSFFPNLHKQVKLLIAVSLAIFFCFCFLPANFFPSIETPGIVCLAFASWIGIYIAILYVDFALFRYPGKIKNARLAKRAGVNTIFFWLSKISVRFVLLAAICFISEINDDHPARHMTNVNMNIQRPAFKDHFASWITHYESDSKNVLKIVNTDSTSYKSDSAYFRGDNCYPVIFICAEGGALRTGAYTALFLARLEDYFRQFHKDFKGSIYAFSGVSGGAVGLSVFNAVSYLTKPEEFTKNFASSDTAAIARFFANDYLSATMAKLFCGEALNLFYPGRIERLDRAAALEESWEYGYKDLLRASSRNVFDRDFLTNYSMLKAYNYPAFFINTTEVETGRQCWLTNVKPDSSFMNYTDRDLFANKITFGLRYSTAVNFSARFPLFSPAAMLHPDTDVKIHYVDGGYYENTGSATMLEILNSLKDSLVNRKVKPYVLLFRFSADNDSTISSINFGNTYKEILNGFLNTRGAHSSASMYGLKHFVEENLHGEFIDLPLEESKSAVPMSWIFSDLTLNNLKSSIDRNMVKGKRNDLQKLWLFK